MTTSHLTNYRRRVIVRLANQLRHLKDQAICLFQVSAQAMSASRPALIIATLR